jgi:glycosyltransferase involved in cell wall biosynthesis
MSAAATSGRALAARRVVVVHRGSRDAYQVAAALAGEGMLQALYTDLYWPGERKWARRLKRILGRSSAALLEARHNAELPASLVRQIPVSGIISFALDKIRRAPFSLRQRATRWTDARLGRLAGVHAAKHNALILSYSYYAADAFRYAYEPGLLFQAHPHPATVRRILEQERIDHPECAASLEKEWELSLDPIDFERLVSEPRLAAHCLVASSFTRQTLIENGMEPDRITVIPYGVDGRRFFPGAACGGRLTTGPLRLLFVGTITQRKGIKYLLEALRMVSHQDLEVTVCGRVVDDLALFKPLAGLVKVRPSVSHAELLAAYQTADLFVFPSVAEGFAQVLLEALACGLPILSTTHTAAPDLVEEGKEGFVVPPRRPDLIAERIEWALGHRRELHSMRAAARARAERFTHQRFREGVVAAVHSFAERSAAAGTAYMELGRKRRPIVSTQLEVSGREVRNDV